MNAFLALPPTDPPNSGNRCGRRYYTLRFATGGDVLAAEHERVFWERAVEFVALRPLIARYVRQVNANVTIPNWQDEFHPRGSFAMAPLALADVTYCPQLGSLFSLGHGA
ncbi:hypothetical protein [Tahibacter amnicola]|uniref:Uncharacterized protein n=1 Tax=Tahibacter amnicola TaxID=2976241 RepID=A0ABY6B8U3_9GAMM|nr:hypothetical protein [Tahibacter amnicola]UXI65941.1 hypothetical protein N4264_14375 [Tahibacter amnicola]